MQIQSIDNEKYLMVLIDQFSRYVEIFCLKDKAEAFSRYKIYYNRARTLHGKEIKFLRADGGGEFNSIQFLTFSDKHGTRSERTMPHSSRENPIVERMHRTLMNTARCFLHFANAPAQFWREAVSLAAWSHNRTPTKALHTQTPYEVWFGRKPDLSDARIFGCTAYATIPQNERHKLSYRVKKCIFLGYHEDSSGYILYDSAENMLLKAVMSDSTKKSFPSAN
jgi:hypothetical protein